MSGLHSAINSDITNNKLTFLQAVINAKDITLPLLSKIKDHVLGLANYTINKTHCHGLLKVFEACPDIVKKYYFDNCGLDSESLTLLARGGKTLTRLTEIVIKSQDIGL